MQFGTVRQRHSQDADPNITYFGWRPIHQGKTERFLRIPRTQRGSPHSLAGRVETQVTKAGDSGVLINGVNIMINADSTWRVQRDEQK
jgi:hypothetical protein